MELSPEAQIFQLREAVRQMEGANAVLLLRLDAARTAVSEASETLNTVAKYTHGQTHRHVVRAEARLQKWLNNEDRIAEGEAA